MSEYSGVKVWIDPDLCTGDGICQELAPSVFEGGDDNNIYYVKETADNWGTETKFGGPGGVEHLGVSGMARVTQGDLPDAIEAAEECPGECIFFEVDEQA